MTDNQDKPSSGEDSNSWAKNLAIAFGLATLYFGTRTWLPERAFLWVAITSLVFYNVISPFRDHWAKPRFWYALVFLLVAHAAFLGYADGRQHLLRFKFWPLVALVASELVVMIAMLGWILGDDYFTRNTRRERERATARRQQRDDASPHMETRPTERGRNSTSEHGR